MRERTTSDRAKPKDQLIRELAELRLQLDRYRYVPTASAAVTRLRQLETVVDIMQLGVTITDLDGTILYSNPSDAAMHGYAQHELLGEDIDIFAPPGRRKPMSARQLDRMVSWSRESRNRRKDGSVFPVQLMSDVVRDEDGQPIAVVTTCNDITNRKRAEQTLKSELAQAERVAALHRGDSRLTTTAVVERERRRRRAWAMGALVLGSALAGWLIGAGSRTTTAARPVPVPMNPADTVAPAADNPAFRPGTPAQR